MGLHRFVVIWLLIVGLVGVYSESCADQADLALEKDASMEDMISEMIKGRLHKRSDPKPSGSGGMSKKDLDWHFAEGIDTLKKASREAAIAKESQIWQQRRMQDAQKKYDTQQALRQLERSRPIMPANKSQRNPTRY